MGQQGESSGLGLLHYQIVAAFLDVSVELVWQMLALPPYSWAAVLVEREIAMKAGDAAGSLSYFNQNLTTTN